MNYFCTMSIEFSINKVNTKIHPDDEMYETMKKDGKPDIMFFEAGYNTIKEFMKIIRKINPSLSSGKKILDYGCGHGRITRHIPYLLNPSNLVGADVWKGGVEFCAQEFGSTPFVVYNENPISNMGLKFDIIIVVSVFSHLPPKRFESNLNALRDSLSENGLMFISVHGKYFEKLHNLNLNLTDGYHYGPLGKIPNHTKGRLDVEEYSFMCVNDQFIREMVRKVGLRVVDFKEEGIGHQDLYTLGF